MSEVVINRKLLDAILDNARALHPQETILLLRGKAKRNRFEISDLVIPPLATRGRGFSSFPAYMLPMDFSLIGSVHSHPSGVLKPSLEDLNHSFGRIIMIVAYPFAGTENVAVYNHSGDRIMLKLSE